jgi:hypothetical protein
LHAKGVITAPAMGMIQETMEIFSFLLKLQLAADASDGANHKAAANATPTSVIRKFFIPTMMPRLVSQGKEKGQSTEIVGSLTARSVLATGARYAQRCPVELGVPMKVVIAA